MSIFVTTSQNDSDLLPLIGNLGVSAPIPHGDFAFWGTWSNGEEVRVCGDRKKMSDLVSCVKYTGRYMEQLRAAKEAGFNFLVLIFEWDPQYKLGYQGLIERSRGATFRWA